MTDDYAKRQMAFLDNLAQETKDAIAFADAIMMLMDQFVPMACRATARAHLTNAARRRGMELRAMKK